jgi:membrane-associated phospholipid phosphatase
VKTETEITSSRFRIIWIALAAVALIALVAAFFLDHAAAAWFGAHSSPELKKAMQTVSTVGDWPTHFIAGLIGIAIAFVANRKMWMRIFLAMLVALALAGVTGRVVKLATGRARPSVKTEAHWNGPRFSSKYHAFPSGHTASSSAFFVALFLKRKKIGAPLLLIPVLIALSRMVLGAHYLSDVTFAAILGVVCAVLAVHLLCPIRNSQSAIGDRRQSPITSH